MAHFATCSRKLVSSILVLWIGLLALGPIVHDGLGHDQDCAPILVHHDPSHHRINGAPFPPLAGGEHCVVCHLFCGSRYTPSPSIAIHAATRLWVILRIDSETPLIASTIVPLPARAPPAYFLN